MLTSAAGAHPVMDEGVRQTVWVLAKKQINGAGVEQQILKVLLIHCGYQLICHLFSQWTVWWNWGHIVVGSVMKEKPLEPGSVLVCLLEKWWKKKPQLLRDQKRCEVVKSAALVPNTRCRDLRTSELRRRLIFWLCEMKTLRKALPSTRLQPPTEGGTVACVWIREWNVNLGSKVSVWPWLASEHKCATSRA